jgi:hypothetical protein
MDGCRFRIDARNVKSINQKVNHWEMAHWAGSNPAHGFMKKITKQVVSRTAEKFGIEIFDTGMAVWYDAPDGFCFKGMPALHYAHVYYSDGRFPKSQVWEMVFSDIKNGVEKCDCCDCKERQKELAETIN